MRLFRTPSSETVLNQGYFLCMTLDTETHRRGGNVGRIGMGQAGDAVCSLRADPRPPSRWQGGLGFITPWASWLKRCEAVPAEHTASHRPRWGFRRGLSVQSRCVVPRQIAFVLCLVA